MAELAGIGVAEAEKIHAEFQKQFPELFEWKNWVEKQCERDGHITTIGKRILMKLLYLLNFGYHLVSIPIAKSLLFRSAIH